MLAVYSVIGKYLFLAYIVIIVINSLTIFITYVDLFFHPVCYADGVLADRERLINILLDEVAMEARLENNLAEAISTQQELVAKNQTSRQLESYITQCLGQLVDIRVRIKRTAITLLSTFPSVVNSIK